MLRLPEGIAGGREKRLSEMEQKQEKFRMSLVSGILGCICFGVGDWLLGYVDPTPIGEDIFYFVCSGHGGGYDAWKIVVTLVMAMIGMCFLLPGMVCPKKYCEGIRAEKTSSVSLYPVRNRLDCNPLCCCGQCAGIFPGGESWRTGTCGRPIP